MFFSSIFQDINHDIAELLQYAARIYDDVFSTISSLHILEFTSLTHTNNENDNIRRTTSSNSTPIQDIENQWCVVQDFDWTYDDNLRVDNSFSI